MAHSSDERQWRKTRRCSNGACVEVAFSAGSFHLRDASGAVLTVTAGQGRAFLAAVKAGRLG